MRRHMYFKHGYKVVDSEIESYKNKPRKRINCYYCGLELSKQNYNRHLDENCPELHPEKNAKKKGGH